MFKPNLRAYATEALEKRTVEVMTGERVASVSPTRVTLQSGTVLEAHTLVWGAGLSGNRLVQSLGLELERGNRIGVGPELDLPDHPEVYVVGDIAAITDAEDGAGAPSARVRRPAVGRVRGRTDLPPHRRQEDQAVQLQGQGHDGRDRARRGGRPDARRKDHEGQEGDACVVDRASRHSCRRTRTARRRWSTGPVPGSRTCAPAGSLWIPTRNRREGDGRCSRRSSSTSLAARGHEPRLEGHDCHGALRRVGRAPDAATGSSR